MSTLTDAVNVLIVKANGLFAQAVSLISSANSGASTATTKAAEAALSAASAAVDADRAEAAALVAADPNSFVSAISKIYNIPNIWAVAVYSGEDSNGWELRTNLPYNNEPRATGPDIGQYANVAAAVADGGLVDDRFYNTTDYFFYKITDTGTPAATRIYRAGSRHLPLVRAAVLSGSAGSARLIIFDLTTPECSMWIEYLGSTDSGGNSHNALGTRAIRDMVWGGSSLYIIHHEQDMFYTEGVQRFDFATGKVTGISPAPGDGYGYFYGTREYQGNLSTASANGNLGFYRIYDGAGAYLPHQPLGKINLHVSPNAPIDPITRMPIPHLVIPVQGAGPYPRGTGGMCVVDTDFKVIASSDNSTFSYSAIVDGRFYGVNTTATPDSLADFGPVEKVGAGFAIANSLSCITTPALSTDALTGIWKAGKNQLAIAHAYGLDLLIPDPNSIADSMIARKGNNFATTWMVQPLAALACDTVTGIISDAELLTQLSAYADQAAAEAGGWTFGTGFTFDAANDEIDVSGASHGVNCDFVVSGLTVGNWYAITYTIQNYVSGGITQQISSGADRQVGSNDKEHANGTYTYSFRASATSATIRLQADGAGWGATDFSIAAVSVKRTVGNFAGSATGPGIPSFRLIGSLEAVAVTSGGIAALEGFDVSNYLECTNPLFDFDAVGFTFACAIKSNETGTSHTIMSVGHTHIAGYAREITFSVIANVMTFGFSTAGGGAGSTVKGLINDWNTLVVIVNSTGTDVRFWVNGQYGGSHDASGLWYPFTFSEIRIGRRAETDANWNMYNNNQFLAEIVISNEEWTGAKAKKWCLDTLSLLKSGTVTLSDTVTAADYDERNGVTKLLTSGEDIYQLNGLHFESVEDVNSITGATETDVSCAGRIDAVSGHSSVRLTVEEKNLREAEPRRDYEYFDIKYEGDASRTQFPLQSSVAEVAAVAGCYPVRVSNAGDIKTEGASDDYAVKTDGFNYWVNFAVAPGSGSDVVVSWRREVYR